MKKFDYKSVKKIGIVAKNGENLGRDIAKIRQILSKFGIELILEKKTAKIVGKNGENLQNLAKICDIIISLGGDGTLLGVCRQTFGKFIPVLGINTGRLGFLTDINMSECKKFFDEFFAGNFKIECPLMLDISLIKGSKTTKKFAFNDIVLMRSKIKSIANIEAFLDKKYFNTYFGDGIIVTSPIGSTAYNLSAGGGIIYFLCEVFCVTPVCSHSLTQRPLVLPKGVNLSFKSSDEIVIVIDGQEIYEMKDFDEVGISISDNRANLLYHANRDYFEVLRDKLRWGHK